jgi:hypothetical protein
MKSTAALLSLSLLPLATPALASEAVSQYFAADTSISLGALALAATVMVAARMSEHRRQVALAAVVRPPAEWREKVLANLDVELQSYSRGLRRAA